MTAIQRPRDQMRVDWFRVLCDLRSCGYSLVAVASAVDIPRSTLQQWGDHDKPVQAKLEDGLRVIEFWCRVTGMTTDHLPWVNRYAPWPKLPGLRQGGEPTVPETATGSRNPHRELGR